MRTVRVAEVWEETAVLQGARLDASPEVRAEHTKPGQVIAATAADGGKVYLALASVPGEDRLELLVAAPASARLGLAVGAEFSIDGPMGKGFPLDSARGRDVLLFAVGSALAPVRPLIEMIRKDRSDFGQVTLFMGALAADAFPYRSHYDRWRRDRVDVIEVVDPRWVQDAFADDPVPVDDAVAFVCGMNAMMDGVTEALGRLGLPADRVHRNW